MTPNKVCMYVCSKNMTEKHSLVVSSSHIWLKFRIIYLFGVQEGHNFEQDRKDIFKVR